MGLTLILSSAAHPTDVPADVALFPVLGPSVSLVANASRPSSLFGVAAAMLGGDQPNIHNNIHES